MYVHNQFGPPEVFRDKIQERVIGRCERMKRRGSDVRIDLLEGIACRYRWYDYFQQCKDCRKDCKQAMAPHSSLECFKQELAERP